MVIHTKHKASFKRVSKGSWMSGAGMSKPISKRLHQKQDDKPSTLKHTQFRVGSWNVGTLKGRASEVVETLQQEE